MLWDFAKIWTFAASSSRMHCINQAVFKKGKQFEFSQTKMGNQDSKFHKVFCTLCVICLQRFCDFNRTIQQICRFSRYFWQCGDERHQAANLPFFR